MRARFLLLAILLLPAIHAAETRTIAAGANYTVEDTTYTVLPLNENATALEKDGRQTILQLKECLQFSYTRSCLTTVTAGGATFSEEYQGAIVTATHTLGASTTDLGDEMNGTVTLKNTGEQLARDVYFAVQLPPGLRLKGTGKQLYTWSGSVRDTITINYFFIAETNRSHTVNGSYSYINGSERVGKTLDNRTLTVEAPITVTVIYEPNATQGASFNVTVKKKKAENYTITMELTLPPEANVTSANQGTRQRGTVLSHRVSLNETEDDIHALYDFLAAPSANATLTVEYEREDEDRQQLNYSFGFERREDIEPSLAISVDPLIAGTPGELHVTVTGNRTGQLWLRGLIDYTTDAGGGTYDFTVPEKAAGNHTLTVQYISEDLYGREQMARGTVTIPVTEKTVEITTPEAEPDEPIPAPAQNTTEEPVIEVEPRSFPFITLAIAGVCLLAVLAFIMHRFRDPITKLERLTARVTKLRNEIQRRSGADREEELVQLAALEEELDMLLRQLERR